MAKKKRSSSQQMAFTFSASSKAGSKTAKPAAKKSKKKTASAKRKSSKKASRLSAKSGRKAASRTKSSPKPRANSKSAPSSSGTHAERLARTQREISISEFFAKNRHLLGFDNPRKALLTTIKEAVDNALDACEEAGILPEVLVEVAQIGEDRFRVAVEDNGPGIVKSQIPNIFGKLLYGSKFHTLRMSRGQQGIGISAAGMYGLLTTGKSVRITSQISAKHPAHYYELQINTKTNRPQIIRDEQIDWAREHPHGTRVEIELEARFQRGRQSVDQYMQQTAIVNPHAHLRFQGPNGKLIDYPRSVKTIARIPKAIRPHPYGVELGVLIKMMKDTSQRTLVGFLSKEFSRVSSRVAGRIADLAGVSHRANPTRLAQADADNIYKAINKTKIMSPATNCICPIGSEDLERGLKQIIKADFYATCTRPPSVYRGNPFQIEAGIAYGFSRAGGEDDGELFESDSSAKGNNKQNNSEQLVRLMRFANRVPLLYQQSACATYRTMVAMNWRSYGLSQSRGALPQGPAVVLIHMASVWVPFTSESKEAVAHYPQIISQIRLALQECGRQLGRYLKRRRRQQQEMVKRSYISKYIPTIGEALQEILNLKDRQVQQVNTRLKDVLEKSRKF
ncbi:MAG: DNA topoisomerase VI subunit B [Actinobacteria bacterium]|nr:DNA topoisomerase VI subunit B [Actinomycetota bacterium]